MANNCNYTIRAVGYTKESVVRLLSVLKYEDPEFCLYRTFSADRASDAERDGNLWVLDIVGDVAWSCSMWLHATDTGREYSGSKLSVLPEICKSLGIGVEVWAEEWGIGFEQHILVNSSGEIVFDETEDVEFVEVEPGEFEKRGGFEDYMEWAFPKEIIG